MKTVTTVLGERPAESLGLVLPHEHLLIDRYSVTHNADQVLDDVVLAAQELRAFKDAGGGTLVDLTLPAIGRDPRALAALADQAGVNVVMGSGWYHEAFYPPDIRTTSTDDLATQLVTELEDGVGNTGIRPGIIGEIGSGSSISPAEERVLRAVARAHLQVPLTISTHAVRSPVGLDQVRILSEEGVEPHRIIVGHCDSVLNSDFHERIAETGAWVQFDLIRRRAEWEADRKIGLIREFIRRGHLDRLLLSHDVCMRSHLHAYGGGGYAFLINEFLPRLADRGVTDDQLNQLVQSNPVRALTGHTQ